mmetsp:Transcript_18385/g.71023  ORF Transcript_18385/g.71023 Transcript_18385/m.71023 type:complete len:251 (+) Transcript_18385:544-1296(+)
MRATLLLSMPAIMGAMSGLNCATRAETKCWTTDRAPSSPLLMRPTRRSMREPMKLVVHALMASAKLPPPLELQTMRIMPGMCSCATLSAALVTLWPGRTLSAMAVGSVLSDMLLPRVCTIEAANAQVLASERSPSSKSRRYVSSAPLAFSMGAQLPCMTCIASLTVRRVATSLTTSPSGPESAETSIMLSSIGSVAAAAEAGAEPAAVAGAGAADPAVLCTAPGAAPGCSWPTRPCIICARGFAWPSAAG